MVAATDSCVGDIIGPACGDGGLFLALQMVTYWHQWPCQSYCPAALVQVETLEVSVGTAVKVWALAASGGQGICQ